MSRIDRFDRGDFGPRYARPEPIAADSVVKPSDPVLAPQPESPSHATLVLPHRVRWPIAPAQLHRVGQSVLADRNGQGRPHKGIDLFADAGTPVLAAQQGQVIRVVDGRSGKRAAQQRAGLFIDVLGRDTLVYRYLHLGEARVRPGQTVSQGVVLGTVAAAHTSGLREAPHLHFEIRQGDVDRSREDYGTPVDPLRLLPPLRA